MCGVIGYVGRREATTRLLAALQRLEYRGYDSAGLCLLTPHGLELIKVVGKIERLRRRADGRWPGCTTGIGHTRWATHGPVTEANAHPLQAGDHADAAIVLNGIIENHAKIRGRLVAEGERFASQTDAEVVAHLVRRAYRGSLVEAVRTAYGELEGHFAFIAMHRDQPGLLVGTRRRCPLVVGLGEGENYLASSMNAFVGETRRVKLVEDGEVAAITADRARVIATDGLECDRGEIAIPWDDASADRRGHETYMLKEIHEQPEAVNATIARNLRPGLLRQAPIFVLGAVDNRDLARFRRIVIVACGTAYHAGLVGRLAIEHWADVACEADVASEWRYRDPRVDEHTLVIGISQSGETADTLGALGLARDRGARTLAITNSPGSQITREVDAVLYTHAGIEMGVAATKTFTAQLAVLYLLALRIAQLRGALDKSELSALMEEVRALPQKLVACLEGLPAIEALAERHHDKPFFLYLGRHAGLPVCLEGALKLKEVAYIPTEAYAAGEMKHGPIALLDHGTPVVCVATRSHVSDKLHSNIQEVRARGAEVIAIATIGDAAVAELADEVLEVPEAPPLLEPSLAVVPLQLLAYHVARRRGLDVDQPRNLAKTVTVE
jgi:glucosamine--fructose-6-phosphate aminotransferase (isomerizing)